MMRRFHRLLLAALFALAFVFAAPAAYAAKDKVLDIQTVTSKGGVTAWLVHDGTVPVISIDFSFDGGLIYDPPGKPGVARLVSILLDEGAADLKSQAFQKQLSDNAIIMGFTPGRDAFYGQLRTLTRNKDLAFRLLHLALTAPRFDADAVTRMKNANTDSILQSMGDPGWLSARTLNGMVFEDHYYGTPGYGTPASMKAITKKDLQDFVHAQFAKNALKVAITGDITPAEAKAALDAIFDGLPEKAAPAKEVKAVLHHVGKTILLPLDVPQTYVVAAEQGIGRDDPDWYAATVMNYILGGGSFDARLMREIRKKRGLTYGVYSSLAHMKDADMIEAFMSCSNAKTAEAIKILKREWEKMAKDGPTAQELADAKSYITGSLLLDLTSTGSISDAMNAMQRDGMDAEFINRRNALIEAVTLADVKRVAARLLKANDLTVILVGKPEGITPDITIDKPPGMTPPAAKPETPAKKK
ncbi:MAG: insulinase family protein [Alphaproteobacteria bacterium]|nr:insulinase family protein [Alphaproteobacteria bacterium]